MQNLFNQLHCKSLYVTGSRVNPHIKNPRDTEYYAIYDTVEEMKAAPNIHNVHKITKDYIYPRVFVWSYLFHYLNESDNYIGEKFNFKEQDFEQIKALAQYVKNHYNSGKIMYHVAMIDAIDKYGYDNIPESAVQAINDLHDLKKSYSEVTI